MAIPHIVALYQWMHDKTKIDFPVFDDTIFIAADLDLKTSCFDHVEDYAGLAHFVAFVRGQSKQALSNPWQVILSYLIQHPTTAVHDLDVVNLLFMAYLAAKPQDAMTWYEDEDLQELLLSTHPETHFTLGKLVTEHYVKETYELFRIIKEPLVFISLWTSYYDNPRRMAALILCLLEQREMHPMSRNTMRGDELIRSGFLHHYILYRLPWKNAD